MIRKECYKNSIAKIKSIRFITMFIMVIINVGIILTLAYGSYVAYRTSFLDVIGTNRSDVLSQIGSRIRDFKNSAYTISNLYFYDDVFMNYALHLDDSNYADFKQYMDEQTRQYKISFSNVNLDYYVVYLSTSGIGYCSDEVPEDYDYMNPEIRIWYKDIYSAHDQIVDVASFKDKFLNRNSFVAARTISSGTGNVIGYLLININEKQILSTYDDVISPNSNIYIADHEGDIISSNISKIVGSHYFNIKNLDTRFNGKEYTIIQLPKHKSLFSEYADEKYGFIVYEETPLALLLEPIRNTRNIVVMLTLILTLIGVLLAWYLSGKVSTPILKLRDSVLQVEDGNLNVDFAIMSFTEIQVLSIGMERMLSKIRELMESEKKKEEQKRKIQYNLLQAQINPHFMYNTLFSIKCEVDMNENEKSSKMLSSFIHLLRSMLSDPDELTSIKKEMESLKQYAELQKFRYGNMLEIIIEYDERLAECKIPQLLIQPLVENAILHSGKEGIDDYTVIAVTCRLENQKIVIEVEDNGKGMSKERINTVLIENNIFKKNHIGIKNISDRIKLHFGEEYGLRIESVTEEGTKVLINIPVINP